MGSRDGAIHNPRDIIDEEPIYNVPKIMDRDSGRGIYNPRGIIDEEPIYNFQKIVDGNGASIIQGKS